MFLFSDAVFCQALQRSEIHVGPAVLNQISSRYPRIFKTWLPLWTSRFSMRMDTVEAHIHTYAHVYQVCHRGSLTSCTRKSTIFYRKKASYLGKPQKKFTPLVVRPLRPYSPRNDFCHGMLVRPLTPHPPISGRITSEDIFSGFPYQTLLNLTSDGVFFLPFSLVVEAGRGGYLPHLFFL